MQMKNEKRFVVDETNQLNFEINWFLTVVSRFIAFFIDDMGEPMIGFFIVPKRIRVRFPFNLIIFWFSN